MAGNPTVIGEGSYTKIILNLPLHNSGDKILANKAKEMKLIASLSAPPLPRGIRGTLMTSIPW
jgi:hypothetical protein